MTTPNLASGTFINGLPTGTIDNLQALLVVEKGQPSSPLTIQASILEVGQYLQTNVYNGAYLPTGSSYLFAGFVSENAAYMTYLTGTSYQLEAGSMDINGIFVTWSSASVRTGVTLTSGTMNYVYGYSTGTTIGLEESTTVPVWDSTLNYWKKTGDNTRRCVGFLQASTVNTIRMFVSTVKGRIVDYWYIDGGGDGIAAPVTSANTNATGTSWAQVDVSASIPAHATEALLVVKLLLAGATDDGIIGVTPWDMGTGNAANVAPYQARGRTGNAGSNNFFGNTWTMIKVSQKFYYKIQTSAGNPRAQIEVRGARFIR